jgi:fructose-1,6-bisphosphatase I
VAAKVIRNRVALAGIAEVLGASEVQNVQGETQQILDQLSDEIMTKRLLNSGTVSMIVSEEDEHVIYPAPELSGEYALAMDPLDGSSNIACNIPVGTIFGIWRRPKATHQDGVGLELFKGSKQVAAGYVLYGPSCMFVYTTGHGVNGFTFDPSVGEFVLTHENMKLPKYSKCYSVNEAYWNKWDKPMQDIVTWIKTVDKETCRPYAGRYVGSLVADFHRNLLYGGIYMYPMEKGQKEGKLRLLYEAAPLTFIIEQAGGKGSNGSMSILDVEPTQLHQRVALFIGNKSDVEMCEQFLAGTKTL